MAGQHGLGRGLSSLIPQKKQAGQDDDVTRRVTAASADAATIPVRANAPRDLPEKNVAPKRTVVPLPEQTAAGETNTVAMVAVGDIVANAMQPRTYFDEEKLQELADSITAHGILQPLTVLRKGEQYELIAGERRLRAARRAGLTTVPVIVVDDVDEQKKLELAIIENVQRHDLNVIEEAKSYQKLAETFDLSQEDIAKRTGKSRSVVANRIRLTKLPIEVQRGLIEGRITEGHAKVILSLEYPEKQRALYDLIITQNMSVRDAERELASGKKHHVGHMSSSQDSSADKTPQERILEEQLAAYFGTKVRVHGRAHGGGEIKVTYFSQDELRTILAKLKF